ncbi:MAG TPA: hypothetical protein DCP92_16675 [Nitrospiraceae bacterium]|jgi:hypothetical protein|nr:hypothetical protein [Nitrospiraceae bacterium]
MMRYKAGDRVSKGSYWDFKSGSRVDLAEEGILPGDERSKYVKCSPILVLLFGPIAGLVYVIALPFIVLGTILTLAGRRLVNSMASIVSFGWRPREAHLGGKKKRQKKP